ncbi:hypothetical protein [Actinocrispum wychmicini]|uniref:Uncharacterized protein n=1 Tax=Actinocrispum wychmicini TaxID=1213861 RepID=A0A4R2JQB5_9PSEU|nr:hypothetical protein [Actinocrispum wychmicini]TCO59368.1 hypothetical protein EV192_104209 [Actinocrispum wychmicini]
MVTALILGAGLGLGLWALAVWAFPPRPALGAVLARGTAAPAPTPILAGGDAGWAARLGRPFIAPLRTLGLPGERLARDLAVIGRPVATHLAEKATLAIAGLLAPVLLQLLLTLAGLSPGIEVPVVAGLVLAAAGCRGSGARQGGGAGRLSGLTRPGTRGADRLAHLTGAAHGWQQSRTVRRPTRATDTEIHPARV